MSYSEADRAIENLNKKLFRGRVLTVERWDGHQNFEIEVSGKHPNRDQRNWIISLRESDSRVWTPGVASWTTVYGLDKLSFSNKRFKIP